MSTFTALDGSIRLYDSTDDKRASSTGDVQVYDDSGPSYSDKTTEAFSDSGSTTGAFCAAASDGIYIGCSSPFARINVDLTQAAVAAGALVATYYNGSAFVSLTITTDGTLAGANTLAVDGVISFAPPSDWAVAGNANLDSDKYYVFLGTTDVASQAPIAEQIWPVDGQYFEVKFDELNLSCVEGRARTEETAIFHRGRGSSDTHYITGPDSPIYEPVEISFSARIDGTYNKTALTLALVCGNPDLDTKWDATGVNTKTDTKVVNGEGSSVATPAFNDSEKKTICIQILWTRDSVSIGRSYHEVLVTPDQISLAEAEDGVILTVTGSVYGPVETIYHFAYQY